MTPALGVLCLPLIVLVLLAPPTLVQSNRDNCTKAKNEYANYNVQFQHCAIEYAEPVHFCEKCVPRYIETVYAWQQLAHAELNNGSCMDEYVDRDRLNLLLMVHGKSQELWEAAACESCFVHLPNGTLTANQTEATAAFYDKLHALNGCISANAVNSTEQVCNGCRGQYADLNDHYTAHVQGSIAETDGVCFDLRDAMNRTRRAWSDVYKCCRDRHESLLAFVACSAVVAVLPALFYAVAVLQRRRSDRLDGPLLANGDASDDDDDDELANDASDPEAAQTQVFVAGTSGGTGGGDGAAVVDDDDLLLDVDGPVMTASGSDAPVAAASRVKLIDLSEQIDPADSDDDELDDVGMEEEEDEISKWKKKTAAEARKE